LSPSANTVPGTVSRMRAVAAASGALHCAISPAPTKTCGVPGAATIAVRVSEAVRPLAPMTPTRTAKAPGFVYRCVAVTSAEPESSGAVSTALSPQLTVHAPELPPIATRAVRVTGWRAGAYRSGPASTAGKPLRLPDGRSRHMVTRHANASATVERLKNAFLCA